MEIYAVALPFSSRLMDSKNEALVIDWFLRLFTFGGIISGGGLGADMNDSESLNTYSFIVRIGRIRAQTRKKNP